MLPLHAVLTLLLLICISPMLSISDTHPGIHNVIRVTDKLLSGSVPEGDTGFKSLQKLGVKTIISVDGARPEVARAKKFGMRYVHLPIGYDGVPAEQGLRLAKAVHDLPGLVYMHCHHGKHRSPAAAVVVKLCLEENCTVQTALDLMKQAGTDPRYLGLYASPRQVQRPSQEQLDKVSSDFPEVFNTGSMVLRMVEMDKCWDHLKLMQKTGWKPSREHPDLEPAHEAMMLWEHYVELGRLPESQNKPPEYQKMLRHAEKEAKELEQVLRLPSLWRNTFSEPAFKANAASCVQCHARYRDVPQH